MAQLVNVIGPIFTDEKRMFLQTIYYALALFAKNTKGQAVDMLVKGPSYKSTDVDDIPHLDSSGAVDGKALVVNIVNRHRSQAVEAETSFGSTAVKTAQRSAKAEKESAALQRSGAIVHDAEGDALITRNGESRSFCYFVKRSRDDEVLTILDWVVSRLGADCQPMC